MLSCRSKFVFFYRIINLQGSYKIVITIGNDIWIVECVCIHPGINISNGCIIDTNAVVSKDI